VALTVNGVLIFWKTNGKVHIGKGPEKREKNPARTTTLDMLIRDFVEEKNKIVVNPAIGTTFDSLPEAYDLYTLYS
jgi:hypothetical protein